MRYLSSEDLRMCCIVVPTEFPSKNGIACSMENLMKRLCDDFLGMTLKRCWFNKAGPYAHSLTRSVADHEKMMSPVVM